MAQRRPAERSQGLVPSITNLSRAPPDGPNVSPARPMWKLPESTDLEVPGVSGPCTP